MAFPAIFTWTRGCPCCCLALQLLYVAANFFEFFHIDWKCIFETFLLLFLMFIYFWDRDRAWAEEGQRERETQDPKQAPGWAVSTEPDVGLKLTDREIMTWAKVGRLTDWATQAPPGDFFFNRAKEIWNSSELLITTSILWKASWEGWWKGREICVLSRDNTVLTKACPFVLFSWLCYCLVLVGD